MLGFKNNKDEVTEDLLNAAPKEKGTRNNLLIIVFVLLGICLLLVAGYFGYEFYKQKQANDALNQGKSYMQKGDYDQAIAYFNKAIESNKDNKEAYQLKAEAAMSKSDYSLAGQTYEELYDETSEADYLTKSNTILSSNTSGNFSNAGKVLMMGKDTFITNYMGATNNLFEIIDSIHDKSPNSFNNFKRIYSFENDTNGINDLQAYNGVLYMKAGGKFGSFDVATQTFHHIPTIPADSIPISPRVSGDKFYYLANLDKGQTAMYREDLSGANGEKICDIANGAKTQDVTTFFLYGNKAFLIYKAGRIDTISLRNNKRTTVYDADGVNGYGASISKGKLYFLHGTDANSDMNIYTYDLSTGEVSELLNINEPIRTLNTNDDSLFYMTTSTLYRADLNGSNAKAVGSAPEYVTHKESTNMPRLILLTEESVYVQYRGNSHLYDGQEGPGEEQDSAVTYRAPLNDLSDFHDLTLIQGYHA